MFGPPQRFTIASTCSWLGHSVSGLRHDTSHPLQIRFRFGFVSLTLNPASHRNSPAHSTKGTRAPSYGALCACKHKVSGSISLPSRGSFHLSLTVLFAIGHMVVFSLLGWSPFLPSGFLVSRRTPDTASVFKISSTGFSPSLIYLSRYFDYPFDYTLQSLPQAHYKLGLGSSDFARHYFRNHFCFLFLRVLRCFSSPGSPHTPIYSVYDNAMLLALSSLIRISTDL